MDLSDALFSPSKARQQQAQAKDWIFVDSWLSKKYHPKPVPAFERNEDTLQALMTLVAFNERADEEQELLEKVERQALRELEEKTYEPVDDNIYMALDSSLTLTAHSSLTAQAKASILLNSPTTNPSILASRTIGLTTAKFDLDEQLLHITHLQTTLSHEHERLESLLNDLQSDAFTPPPGMSGQTALWARDTKMLQLKLDEYNERLSQSRSIAPPRPNAADVRGRVAELEGMKRQLREVEEKISAYEGLPPDVGEARKVLEGLKADLRVLVARRDEGFEGLVERGIGSRLPIRRS